MHILLSPGNVETIAMVSNRLRVNVLVQRYVPKGEAALSIILNISENRKESERSAMSGVMTAASVPRSSPKE